MSNVAYVKEIYIYPVKSLAGVKLEKCLLTKFGIAHPDVPEVIDRKWMVIDSEGNFLTQRKFPKMALIKPVIAQDYLILTANNTKDCKVPLKPTQNLINCRVWNLKIDAFRYGGEISKWLSEFLQKEGLDLANFGTGLEPRKVTSLNENNNQARHFDEVIYHDYSPYMLISEMSLNDLNGRLKEPVTIRNFRPNFFVTDCDAYSEDNWVYFTIGNSRFYKIKHCTRCLLTTVNPDTGVKSKDMEPLNTLKSFRINKEKYGFSPLFGINIVLEENSAEIFTAKVGDPIVRIDN